MSGRMKNDWLWDRKLTIAEAKRILKAPDHKNFSLIASLLFSRKNEPREVFGEYIEPLLFCKNWAVIKRRMRKDEWNQPRIIFWQAIYEKLQEKYRRKGIVFRKESPLVKDTLCKTVGGEIRKIRKQKGLSQKALAEKLGFSQQLMSRVEQGKENLSLITLKRISGALGRKVEVTFVK